MVEKPGAFGILESFALNGIFFEFFLRLLEGFFVEDTFMLACIDLAVVFDFSDIYFTS
jgi:hypothetical protein